MILADTSVWVEYLRGTRSAADKRLAALIGEPGELAVTEPVVMEVLAGACNAAEVRALRGLLHGCSLLPVQATADFDNAARIHRRCRSHGLTPRGLLDCLIAAVADRTGSSLLACDRDLIQIAGVAGLELCPLSGSRTVGRRA